MAITYYSSYSRTKMIINVHNPGYAFWLSPVSRQNEDLNLKIILQHLVQMVGMEAKIVPRSYQMITERICSRPLSIFTGMDAGAVKI